MTTRTCGKFAMIAALLTPAQASLAQVEHGSRAVSRSHLVRQLSDALESFDRGTALMRRMPDESLTAFRRARDGFHAAVDAGIENGRLYYNLGNTHFRLGEIGEAIADYRRAQRLVPGDQRLKVALQLARSLRRNHIESSGKRTLVRTVFFWHYSWPARTRGTVAMIGYGLFWLLLAVRTLWRRGRLGYPILACLALWVLLGVSATIELASGTGSSEGVLVRDDVVVRKGNGEGYDPQFKQPLYEGVEFRVVEQRGGWLRIELADGNQGWVRQREVDLF